MCEINFVMFCKAGELRYEMTGKKEKKDFQPEFMPPPPDRNLVQCAP